MTGLSFVTPNLFGRSGDRVPEALATAAARGSSVAALAPVTGHRSRIAAPTARERGGTGVAAVRFGVAAFGSPFAHLHRVAMILTVPALTRDRLGIAAPPPQAADGR